MRAALAAAALLLGGASPAAAGCKPVGSDAAWRDRALAHWRVAERTLLHLAPAALPSILMVDARCTWTGRADAHGRLRWTAAPHGDPLTFPGGNKAKVGPISFATADAGGYFAMSLPSVWRAAGVTSGLGLERLMDGVMLHELMHTRQFYFANPTLTALTARYGLPADISDDSLQATFEHDPDYKAAYEAERDTLYAAAAAPDDAQARALAGKALDMVRARRARWFTGAAARWAPLDDLFLDMEGLGQWLAYAWYRTPAGGGVPAATALKEVRRGGTQWTQDEGLALFLVVDRLVPDWQRDAFAAQPMLAQALLAKAATAPSRRAR